MTTKPPALTTKRLCLRLPNLNDWPSFAALMASKRAQYMGGPFSERDAWGLFCHGIALWELYGNGNLTIEHRESGTYLGQVEINRGPLFPEAELGWQLTSEAEGKGYAFEAAGALRDWAFREGSLTKLVSYIHPFNTRSIQLAERLGAYPDDTAPRQDAEDLVYRHTPPTDLC